MLAIRIDVCFRYAPWLSNFYWQIRKKSNVCWRRVFASLARAAAKLIVVYNALYIFNGLHPHSVPKTFIQINRFEKKSKGFLELWWELNKVKIKYSESSKSTNRK